MALTILDRLGASGERLRAYWTRNRAVNGLVRIPLPVAPIDRDGWMTGRPLRAREAGHRRTAADDPREIP